MKICFQHRLDPFVPVKVSVRFGSFGTDADQFWIRIFTANSKEKVLGFGLGSFFLAVRKGTRVFTHRKKKRGIISPTAVLGRECSPGSSGFYQVRPYRKLDPSMLLYSMSAASVCAMLMCACRPGGGLGDRSSSSSVEDSWFW